MHRQIFFEIFHIFGSWIALRLNPFKFDAPLTVYWMFFVGIYSKIFIEFYLLTICFILVNVILTTTGTCFGYKTNIYYCWRVSQSVLELSCSLFFFALHDWSGQTLFRRWMQGRGEVWEITLQEGTIRLFPGAVKTFTYSLQHTEVFVTQI